MIIKIKQLILDGDYEIKFVKYFRGYKNIPIKGLFIPENYTILINDNLSISEKTTTIIHEFLHEIYPEWNEDKVEKTSIKLKNNLNKKDRLFFENLIKSK